MVRSKNASWYFSYRWNGNGSCENEQEQGNGGILGIIYYRACSGILSRTEITDWLASILIKKIKPPYNLKYVGNKVVFYFMLHRYATLLHLLS